MRKYFVSFLLTAALLYPFTAAYSQEPDRTEQRGVISATGTATESVSPDTAILTLSIETTAKSVNEAVSLNSKKANDIVSKLNSLINKKNGDLIRTSSYSINPVYEYNETRKKSELRGYRVSNQITVKTKQITNVGNLIDSAVESGANQVEGVSFTVENRSDYCKSVLTKASLDAMDQINSVANALGIKVAKIKNISLNCGSDYIQPMYKSYGGDRAMMSAEAAPTPIEPGEIKINATVSIDGYLQ